MEVCYCLREAISSSEFFIDPKFEELQPTHAQITLGFSASSGRKK
jgi:hypothetical protein